MHLFTRIAFLKGFKMFLGEQQTFKQGVDVG